MADINLRITLKDLNVAKATERFLKARPNDETQPKEGEVPDENGDYTPDQLELKYPTTKAWVEEVCRRHIYRQIQVGHQKLQREVDDALESQDDYLN